MLPRRHAWIKMEAAGPDLKSLLRLHPDGLEAPLAKAISRQVLCGLRALMDAAVVHSDVKPENLLLPAAASPLDAARLVLAGSGVVKVCDLGSASPADDVDQEADYPRQTRDYRAPEAMLGCHFGPPADMWSMGCCVFEMLTGERLFDIVEEEGELERDFEQLGLMMELLGPVPPAMAREGRRVRPLMSRTGVPKSPRCRDVRRWPLREVMIDKYGMPAASAAAAAAFVLTMLTWRPERRTTPGAALSDPWLES